MSAGRKLARFSANRLGGEPVPDDVRIVLANNDELAERTGIALRAEKRWAPWLDTSYLSAEALSLKHGLADDAGSWGRSGNTARQTYQR